MSKRFFNFFAVLLLLPFLTGCPAPVNFPINTVPDFKLLTGAWNDAHSSKDVGVLSDLYADSVLLYGAKLPKNLAITNKLDQFNKTPDYYQQIHGDIQIENINESEVRSSFVKRVTLNQRTNDYPSYLVFENTPNGFKITVEGDLVTDKNLAKNRQIPDNAVKGDFNGDGVLDYMWLEKPKIIEDGLCEGYCSCIIRFSDPEIPSITVEQCIGGSPENLGDLNQNGAHEVGIAPGWFWSFWRSYHVWTLIDGEWVYAVEPFSVHDEQFVAGIKPIEKDYSRQELVIIRYSESADNGLEFRSKSVRIVR